MFVERRQSVRRPWAGLAQIKSKAWTFPRECRVTDVSDGGVRLYAEMVEIPDEFEIVFGGTAGRVRPCRVVWRLGHEIGAEFTDTRLLIRKLGR